MKRPAPWQARRIATQKALRALPKCETEGCEGKAIGAVWTFAPLCPKCQGEKQRAQREKRT